MGCFMEDMATENSIFYEDEVDNFFEMQKVIKDDFKRIFYITSDCNDCHEKESLMSYINSIIESICLNRFYEEDHYPLRIILTEKYLAFSFFPKEELNDTESFDITPTIAIVSRNIKNLEVYFVGEEFDIFDEEEDDTYNRALVYCDYFKINDNKIEQANCNFKEYTVTTFYDWLYDPNNFTSYIKTKIKK